MKEMITNGKPEGDVMTLHPKRSLWAGSRLMRYTWLLLLLMMGMTQQARSQSWIIGAPDPSIGASASFSALVQFVLFDVMHPAGVVIDSVDVYPTSGPGQPFTIVIQNSSQNVIASWSGTTTVASGQPQRIKLDLHIPQGTGYRWGFSVNPGMLRNSTGGVYPYTVPGVMSITGNTFNVVYYYFFYNIRIRLPYPPQSNDAGISAITAPNSPISPGLNDVIVSIENHGTDTLTSAQIGWSVNGVNQTSYAWTGTLAPSGIAPGILLGNYNFPLGTSSIAAWTSLPNGQLDSISQNDTATKSVIACNLLSGVFTVGDSTADYLTISDAVGAVGACGVSGPVTFNILPGVYNEQVSIP
ncbi:MAG: hypothetical protein KA053_09965, partial [Lentimicrobiaceae bacterium]|nr:hypothetical protein [Lentimicrobiaceae bacterium]